MRRGGGFIARRHAGRRRRDSEVIRDYKKYVARSGERARGRVWPSEGNVFGRVGIGNPAFDWLLGRECGWVPSRRADSPSANGRLVLASLSRVASRRVRHPPVGTDGASAPADAGSLHARRSDGARLLALAELDLLGLLRRLGLGLLRRPGGVAVELDAAPDARPLEGVGGADRVARSVERALHGSENGHGVGVKGSVG